MKTIYRYSADIEYDDFTIDMPVGAQVLHARAFAQAGGLQVDVWAVVDTEASTESRAFSVRGTGHPLGEVGAHIATVFDGGLVWHIFDAPVVVEP